MTDRFAVPGTDAATPLRVAAPAIVLAKAEPVFASVTAATRGADAKAVHDMRVASRRLREALRLFEPLYDPHAIDAAYRRVRGITRALGPVRDSDVFIETFSSLVPEVDKSGKRAIAFLIGYRSAVRNKEFERLRSKLARVDVRRDRRIFATTACAVRDTPEADQPLGVFAREALRERVGVVKGGYAPALIEGAVGQQHALRIAVKRLRYALEVFAPCYTDGFDAAYGTLTEFQDTLGVLHDAHVFLGILRDEDLRARALAAGVSPAGFDHLAAIMRKRAHAAYVSFETLADQYSASDLEHVVLDPLD
ncbi:MAG: CHAD domain-containing protein [Coriobacteriales bacterium]